MNKEQMLVLWEQAVKPVLTGYDKRIEKFIYEVEKQLIPKTEAHLTVTKLLH